ncbi:MAG TPA: type II toxin-antitoxin system RelE/ParE family toxin [Rudaea sp.]|jgi:proteic killer suppression protein|uniref:type II toxin-antitoxin system RelE/ParE family toxin n=1 Tax=Rudaea sp. TaxID=2136325 RepID=UPI002F943A69
MIRSFHDADTESLFHGHRVLRWRHFESVAMRKLAMLNRAGRIDDLRIPPNNRLEKLKGKRDGQWSIRVNDQWRVCFRWSGAAAHDVEIVDYH